MSFGQLFTWMFWIGIVEASYAYLGFPALAAILARRADGAGRMDTPASSDVVTVVIPA